jgi:hypothetical protein
MMNAKKPQNSCDQARQKIKSIILSPSDSLDRSSHLYRIFISARTVSSLPDVSYYGSRPGTLVLLGFLPNRPDTRVPERSSRANAIERQFVAFTSIG